MRRSWSCPPGQGAAMPGRRGGIRLRFDPGVDPEVRRALMQFVRWLQTQYAFPVRVPVYVRAAERLLCRDGDFCGGRRHLIVSGGIAWEVGKNVFNSRF